MAPHVVEGEYDYIKETEFASGKTEFSVWFTSHRTDIPSFGADFAHFLVRSNPKRFQEVADKKGKVCTDLGNPKRF